MTKKILIVDDSPIARKMLKKYIPKKENFIVSEASNGLEGLDMFKEIRPDITFMDLTMPVMDGMQALEEIKKIDKNAIVIVSTADVQPKSISKVLSLGAFDVVKKPPQQTKVEEVMREASKTINSGG